MILFIIRESRFIFNISFIVFRINNTLAIYKFINNNIIIIDLFNIN